MTGPRSAALALALAAVAAPAGAHEVLHAVERGRAVAVRAYFPGGEPLAYAEYQVFSPADPRLPHQKGRTDRNGWLAFVPDTAGKWQVRVADATGHGVDLEVEAAPPAGATSAGALPAIAFVLRPLVGIVGIAALFALLYLAYRRKQGPR